MKQITKFITLCMVLFVGCAFVIPAQMGTLESHAASKVKISKKKATITKGKTLQLKIKGTKKKVKWSSSKKSVATVSKKGKVTAKKPGKATITAKVGGKKLKCKVTVTKYPNYKKLIIGRWEGNWMDGGYIEFDFLKNGEFYSFAYHGKYYGSVDGQYRIRGNRLELDTGETYTIKSIKKGKLTLNTLSGPYTLQAAIV